MKYLSIAIISLILMSCGSSSDSKPKDETKPQVVISNPEDGEVFAKGSTIVISGVLSDNEALASCSFSLKFSKPATASGVSNVKVVQDPFSPESQVVTLDGEVHSFEDFKLFDEIPADSKSGEYLLEIVVADAAGNKTSLDIILEIE